MDGLLRRLGLDYTRVAAVDGKSLSDETVLNWPVRPGRSRPRGAEIATVLSHAECWKAVAGGDGSYGLILEDDVVFARNFVDLLADPGLLAGDPDLVRLESWPDEILIGPDQGKLSGGYRRHRQHEVVAGSACYLISRAHAARMLDHARIYRAPVDLMLYSNDLCGRFRIMTIVPAATIQYQHMTASLPPLEFMKSTIGHVPVPGPIPRRHPKIVAKVLRFVRKLRLNLRGRRRTRIELHPVGVMQEA